MSKLISLVKRQSRVGPDSDCMLPGLALGWFARQLELGDADTLRFVIEDNFYPFTDCHVFLFFWPKVAIHQVCSYAESVVWRRSARLFIQFHQHNGEGSQIAEGGYDRMGNDLVAVYGPFAANLLPVPF